MRGACNLPAGDSKEEADDAKNALGAALKNGTSNGLIWRKEKMPKYDEELESAVDLELFLTAMENGVRFKHVFGRYWTHRIGHKRK